MPAAPISRSGLAPLVTGANRPNMLFGVCAQPSSTLSCLILCEEWCGWPFLLPAFGLCCAGVYSSSPDHVWLPVARPDNIPIFRLPDYFAPSSGVTCLLLSGSPSWFSGVFNLGWSSSHSVLWHCTDASYQDGPLPFRSTVAHPALGGLLEGTFTFFSSVPFAPLFLMGGPPRALSHVMSVAVRGGTPVVAPPLIPQVALPFIEWGGSLPVTNPTSFVRCRSVFSPTKWTLRQLTPTELLAVYDIPQQERVTAERYTPSTLPFLKQAPIKALHFVLAHWSPTKCPLPRRLDPLPSVAPLELAYPANCFDVMTAQAADAIAVKSDDAVVPVKLWDDRVWEGISFNSSRVRTFEEQYGHSPLNPIRRLALQVWQRNVRRSLIDYLKKSYGSDWFSCQAGAKDREVGRDCLWRVSYCDWWEWPRGSTLFFWRWPTSIRGLARDGHPVWWLSEPPRCMRLQPRESDPVIRDKVRHKIQNIRDKRYILPGSVSNVTSYFAVPKGDSDIRLVYDATRLGLNNCIWVPTFMLPPTEAMTDRLTDSSWMSDHDIGEMFLNFPMHDSIQPYSGIDIRPYCSPDSPQTHIERWVRCMMGWVAAPYITTQSLSLAKEVIWGDFHQQNNPYDWSHVELNLPGDHDYTPALPWVRRVTSAGDIASDCPTYVDDARIISSSLPGCVRAGHKFATTMCYLGIQVAARKVHPPSHLPGAWAGAVALVGPAGVGVTCLPEKWVKAQTIIQDTLEEVKSGGLLNHKILEQRRGFLNHIQRVFPAMTPFLKGFHLTLDGWRPGRDEDMWKLRRPLEELDWNHLLLPSADPPEYVTPAPRLLDDLHALSVMFRGDYPTIRMLRPSRTGVAVYGIGDASGAGYGSAFTNTSDLWFCFGVWGPDADDVTSNFRELRNLTEAVELGVQTGRLQDCELFIYTNNTTAEGAYYKGNSDSRALFDLVVRLRRLDMAGGLRLHMSHIAGTRMIASGVDGLSRGNLSEGLLLQPSPSAFSSFVPLHLSALARSPSLLTWLRAWIPYRGISPLSPTDWYIQGHGLSGKGRALPDGGWDPELSSHKWFLWDPAPAAAGAAVEELGASRHKGPHLNHVFLCPRLLTQYWRKRLSRLADIVLELPPGAIPEWPLAMHEPLLIALTLRFTTVSPWQLRQSPAILELGRQVQGVWHDQVQHDQYLLHKLCRLPATLEAL